MESGNIKIDISDICDAPDAAPTLVKDFSSIHSVSVKILNVDIVNEEELYEETVNELDNIITSTGSAYEWRFNLLNNNPMSEIVYLNNIKNMDIREIKAFAKPPVALILPVSAYMILMNISYKEFLKCKKDPYDEFVLAKKVMMFVDASTFIKSLIENFENFKANPSQLSPDRYKLLNNLILENPEQLNIEKARMVSTFGYILLSNVFAGISFPLIIFFISY